MAKEHTIWQNEHLDLEDWSEDLKEYYPDATEDELYPIMIETNNDYLDDERANLDKVVAPNGILCVAKFGLWDGVNYP